MIEEEVFDEQVKYIDMLFKDWLASKKRQPEGEHRGLLRNTFFAGYGAACIGMKGLQSEVAGQNMQIQELMSQLEKASQTIEKQRAELKKLGVEL